MIVPGTPAQGLGVAGSPGAAGTNLPSSYTALQRELRQTTCDVPFVDAGSTYL